MGGITLKNLEEILLEATDCGVDFFWACWSGCGGD